MLIAGLLVAVGQRSGVLAAGSPSKAAGTSRTYKREGSSISQSVYTRTGSARSTWPILPGALPIAAIDAKSQAFAQHGYMCQQE